MTKDNIVIKRLTATKSAPGVELTKTWSTLATVDAYIYPLSQSEAFRKYGKAVTNLWQAFVDPTDVKAQDRVEYSGHTFEITGVVNLGNADKKYQLDLQEVKP